MIESNKWYRAENQYGDEDDYIWFNYFFKTGTRYEYFSIAYDEINILESSVDLVIENEDEFEDGVGDGTYIFEDFNPNENFKQTCISVVFRNE